MKNVFKGGAINIYFANTEIALDMLLQSLTCETRHGKTLSCLVCLCPEKPSGFLQAGLAAAGFQWNYHILTCWAVKPENLPRQEISSPLWAKLEWACGEKDRLRRTSLYWREGDKNDCNISHIYPAETFTPYPVLSFCSWWWLAGLSLNSILADNTERNSGQWHELRLHSKHPEWQHNFS